MSESRAAIRRILGIDANAHERDPDIPCPSRDFVPGDPAGQCETDGHYMCKECAHADPDALREREEECR